MTGPGSLALSFPTAEASPPCPKTQHTGKTHLCLDLLMTSVPMQGDRNLRIPLSGRIGSTMGPFGFGQCTAGCWPPGSERYRALASPSWVPGRWDHGDGDTAW